MPLILEGSIQIMSRAGAGVAMFCIGLFMALQEKIVHCSLRLTIYGMVLRFVAAPLLLAVGSFSMGLRGDVLRVAIIQVSIQVLYNL
ncbi:putative membrane transport protein [Helianthus annuus]|uniref:Membrane transport protein n=1 Tax=Helianthus annuus TaxID=4232 RepID=A0A9K3I6K1_HELAN|nr:putative membrane transport protein [Helianthus annuus]KAJ0526215.1 putative membrane transport protein [Helianthus annuus]KAJ0542609.1 putative membrane transport protein [Helianthus annuus]KAJ0707667.1 putative membrane transport protein [Helianthus annuus]KAJ0711649.1 putative membrane transport protein [Helianthus annuus]